MKALLLCLGLTAIGHSIYHLGQKSLPTTANPMVLLMGVYTVALLLAALAMPLFRTPGDAPWTTQLFSRPVLVLGVGVLLIEVGFLLVYRRGGGIQWAGVAVSALSALVLVPVGIAYFKEGLSLGRLLGVVLTLGGLVLMVRK